MARKLYIFFILFIFLISSNCFASDWDLSFEKEMYKQIGQLALEQREGNFLPVIQREQLYTDAFINTVFNSFEEKVEPNYSQDDYPYFVAILSYDYIALQAFKTASIKDNILFETDNISVTISFDENNVISITDIGELKTNKNVVSRYLNCFKNYADTTFLLSDLAPQNVTYSDENLPLFCAFQRNGTTFSSSDINLINKFNPKNNVLLNKEYECGNNLTYNVNYYYYDENNSKISVNDKISNNIVDNWWGVSISPYITKEHIISLEEGIYYCDYYFGARNSNNFAYSTTKEVFEIFYKEVEEPSPSGDTPSGDIPGGDTPNYNDKLDNISGLIGDTNIKLDVISGEIGQTNTKLDGISGELGELNENLTTVPDLTGTTINSDDIESALNFDFVEDPYSNFWLNLNTGLSSALTGNNRTITISFRNKNYIISLDDFALQVPQFLKSFLAIISTSLVVWQIVRYIKIIVDKISSGDMDSVLAMNEEERNS